MSFLVRLPEELYDPTAFDAFAPGPFSLGAARAMAWLSRLSYEDDPQKVDRILKRWSLQQLSVFRRTVVTSLPMVDTRGIVAKGPGALFLLFSGTDPLAAANWATNFAVLPDAQGAHQGFVAALEAVWDDLSKLIGSVLEDRKLIVAGHSLGGAIAILAAERLGQGRDIHMDGVYTFGMPRAVLAERAVGYNDRLGQKTYRLVRGADIVATVPPSDFGFRHVGRMLKCDRNDRFDSSRLESKPSDNPKFSLRLIEAIEGKLFDRGRENFQFPPEPGLLGLLSSVLPPAIADHLPDGYCRALRE